MRCGVSRVRWEEQRLSGIFDNIEQQLANLELKD